MKGRHIESAERQDVLTGHWACVIERETRVVQNVASPLKMGMELPVGVPAF